MAGSRDLVPPARGDADAALHGGALALIGEKGRHGGRARITLDGRSRVIRLHVRGRTRTRQVIDSRAVGLARHRLTVQVLSGTVTLEGVAILARRSLPLPGGSERTRVSSLPMLGTRMHHVGRGDLTFAPWLAFDAHEPRTLHHLREPDRPADSDR